MRIDDMGDVRPDDTLIASAIPTSSLAAAPATTRLGQRTTVYAVDALCGAQKSTAAAEIIADGIAQGERYIVAGLTVDQTNDFADKVRAKIAAHTAIPAWKAISHIFVVNAEELRTAADEDERLTVKRKLSIIFDQHAEMERQAGKTIGKVVIITHAALFAMPWNATPDGWHVIVDEANAALDPNEVTLPNAVLEKFRFRDAGDGSTRMRADKSFIKTALDCASDLRAQMLAQGQSHDAVEVRNSIENPLRAIYRKLESGNWRITASRRLLVPDREGRFKLKLSSRDTTTLVLTHVLDWDAFLGVARPRWKSFTIMAANLKHSFAAMTLRKQGYRMVDHPTITPKLAYTTQHLNGPLVTLLYAQTTNASKKKRDLVIDGKPLGMHVRDAIQSRWDGLEFGWASNLDLPNDFLKGMRLPFTAHGLNRFQHLNRIAVLSIANLKPQQEEALIELGFSKQDIRNAVMNEIVYQTLLRGSARNPNSNAEFEGVVLDREAADYILRLMPGAKLGVLGSPEPPQKAAGRPREHEDAAAQQRYSRSCKMARKKASVDLWWEAMIEDVVGPPDLCARFYEAEDQKHPSSTMEFDSFDHLEAFLLDLMNAPPVAEKTEGNALILQAALKPSKQRNRFGRYTARAKSNIETRSTIWIDIESLHEGASGPPIPWETLKAIFPGLRMFAYSSFNHVGTAEGTRYRVVIPLTHSVGSIAYEGLCRLLRARIEAKNWRAYRPKDKPGTRYHGIDTSKESCTSMFWLPVTRIGGEDDVWCESVPGEPLDVAEWIGTEIPELDSPIGKVLGRLIPEEFIIKPPVEAPEVPLTEFDAMLIGKQVETAINDYLGLGKGVQNFELNTLAWRCAGYGLPYSFIEQELLKFAPLSHSSDDRQRQVDRIMRGLRTKRG
jgi:hypothetical protein